MQLLVNALIAGSLLALVAGGLSLVYGVLGIFNLALGQLVLVGGYATWWLTQDLGLPLFLSIPLGTAIGGLVTWVSFEIAVAPFYRHHRFLPLVTTIGLSMILDAALLLLFGERPRAILPGEKHVIEILTMRFSVEQVILVCTTLVFLLAIATVLQQTALGGIYIGIDQNLTPTIAFSLTIKAYAALIAGGKDNLFGAIFMSYVIALLEQLLIGLPWAAGYYLPAGYQSVVALLFIIVVLLIKPTGLFSSFTRTT